MQLPPALTGGPVARRGWTVVGLAANARFIGAAVTIDGEPVYRRVVRPGRRPHHLVHRAVSSLLAPALRHFHPAAIVLLVDDARDARRAAARELVENVVRPAIAETPLPTLEVTTSTLAKNLGLSKTTNVALRDELLRRAPIRLGRGDIDRKESERYWETAVLATGATQVPFCDPPSVIA